MLVIPLDGFALGFVLLVGLIALVAVLRQRRRQLREAKGPAPAAFYVRTAVGCAHQLDGHCPECRGVSSDDVTGPTSFHEVFSPLLREVFKQRLTEELDAVYAAHDEDDYDELMPVPVAPAESEPEVVPPAAALIAPEMLETTSATTALSYFAGTATSPDGVALHSVPMTAHQRIPCGCLLKTRPCQCRFCPMDGAHPIRVVPCHEHKHLAGEELLVADPVLERIKRQK